MPLQYDMTGIDPALAARITATLDAARAVQDSKFNDIESKVQANGINFIVITSQIPSGFNDTGAAFMNARPTGGFNDTLYIVIPADRKFLTTGGSEIDPGIGVVHELSHNQLGRPTEPTREGEAAAVQDHIDVGHQLSIPDDELRPYGTWPRLNEDNTSPTLSIDKADAEDVLGHPFGGSQAEVSELKDAIATGGVTALGDYVALESNDRQLASFDAHQDKIVISFEEGASFSSPAQYASVVTGSALERTVQFDTTNTQFGHLTRPPTPPTAVSPPTKQSPTAAAPRRRPTTSTARMR
jgi:hypothetical protein